MLESKKIVAISPELGNNEERTASFYETFNPEIETTGSKIFDQNINSALYVIQKAGYMFEYII
jgi:hypothetical protein